MNYISLHAYRRDYHRIARTNKKAENSISNNWTKYISLSKILCKRSYELVKSLFFWMLSDNLSSYNFSVSDIAAYDR